MSIEIETINNNFFIENYEGWGWERVFIEGIEILP